MPRKTKSDAAGAGSEGAKQGGFWRFLRRAFLLGVFVGTGLLLFVLGCNWWVLSSTEDKIHASVEEVSACRVGVVLGTSPKVRGGRPNLHFTHRVEAAASLFRAGKVEYLLVSGDNRTHSYNEPKALRKALIEAGVPGDRVVCDYAGLRTLDSMVRAGAVFGLNDESFLVISDDFHVPRAVFIARHEGLDAFGFSAEPVGARISIKSRQREKLARVKAVLDIYLFGTEPRFLGPFEPIGDEDAQVSARGEDPEAR